MRRIAEPVDVKLFWGGGGGLPCRKATTISGSALCVAAVDFAPPGLVAR